MLVFREILTQELLSQSTCDADDLLNDMLCCVQLFLDCHAVHRHEVDKAHALPHKAQALFNSRQASSKGVKLSFCECCFFNNADGQGGRPA